MNTLLRVCACLLLLFNGAGALYGGAHLISDPSGMSIQLSPQWLEHTMFSDYLIPGIVLFIFNGLFSMIVLSLVLKQSPNYEIWTIAQGSVLIGWLGIQMLMIRTVYFLHLVMGAVGLALIACGYVLFKMRRQEK